MDAPEIGELKILSPEETKEKFPIISGEWHALFVEGGARVDGKAMRDALINGAKKLGAEIVYGEAVWKNNELWIDGVRTDAEAVILTAGAWGNEIPSTLGLDLNVTFQKAQIMHFQLENDMSTGNGQLSYLQLINICYLLKMDKWLLDLPMKKILGMIFK